MPTPQEDHQLLVLFPGQVGANPHVGGDIAVLGERPFRKGRRVRSGTIHWFLMLYVLSAFKPIRRSTLRHQREMAHLEKWLAAATTQIAPNYDVAVEVLNARRLIKGYSDTHVRGESKFDRVIGAVPLLAPRADGADWMRRLRDAALLDEQGIALDGALKTIATL